jgi:hypothetical protein
MLPGLVAMDDAVRVDRLQSLRHLTTSVTALRSSAKPLLGQPVGKGLPLRKAITT